jgi:uncharacterized Zn-binding protein involved in type VI secretion
MAHAARILDLHACPVHGGGVVQAPCVPTVLVGSMAAATQGSTCVCMFGPPNTITGGSTTVKVGFMAAARVGDDTAHGGRIVKGYPTVLIGG